LLDYESVKLTVSSIDILGLLGHTRLVEGLYRAFGRALKSARTDAGLTQREVAQRVGLARTSITNIERGTQHISLHQLFLLASAVGARPEELLPDEHLSLEDLVPARALRDLRAEDDERDFAVRVLRQDHGVSQAVRGDGH
jgi:transcriptional regulator with XRE-family HTH domain